MSVAALFVQRAAGRATSAGTEVQGGLVGAGRLQGQGEMLLLASGDTVSLCNPPLPPQPVSWTPFE